MCQYKGFGERCECSDGECPNCNGDCEALASVVLFRVDMEDLTGTHFCEGCADAAMDSGLFTDQAREDEDDDEGDA